MAFSERRGATRREALSRVMSALAAVLVVGILIGGSVLLFGRSGSQIYTPNGTASTSQQVNTSGTPSHVDVGWDGLEMSMSVTPGPYFLGELLAVDLTLTNHTHPTLTLGGSRHTSNDFICGYSSLEPEQSGGTAPHYTPFTTPAQFIISCTVIPAPGPSAGPALAPGKTVHGHFYVLLASSGDVTLTGAAFFFVPLNGFRGAPGWQRSSGPLTGHLPALRVHVAPQAPANRTLAITRADASSATIQAPAGLQLLAQTYTICQGSDGYGWPSGTAVNRGDWPPLSTRVVQRPACNGSGLTFAQWKFAVGAIGYEVVQGQYGQYSSPTN